MALRPSPKALWMFNDPITKSYPQSPLEVNTHRNTMREGGSGLGFTMFSSMLKNKTFISNPKSPISVKAR